MEGRGRKSTASLSVLPTTTALNRVDPPDYLTDSQASHFVTLVDSQPAEWFGTATVPLLVEYVRAFDMCNLLESKLQNALLGDDLGIVKAVSDMRDKESKRLTSIATKLRLTQQSRYTPQAAATAGKKVGAGAKPWQFGN